MFRRYKTIDGLKLELPEAIFDDIKECIKKFYPNECGGIFVGKIIDENTAVVEKMMIPDKFKSTPVYFTRVSSFLNTWLRKVFTISKGETIYLGEWHSHPNGYPLPSGTDLRAMENISKNSDVRMRTPLLLIVGYNQIQYREKFYIYRNNNLQHYEHEQ
jgi:integrative and conjugative element protein (TIGR02256 family)